MVSGNYDLSSRLEYRLEGSKEGTESLKGLRKYKKGECSVGTTLLQEEGQWTLKGGIWLVKSFVVMSVEEDRGSSEPLA